MKCASVKAAGVDCDDDGRKRDPERYASIHSADLDQHIANFGEVAALSGHPVFARIWIRASRLENASRSTSPRKWPSSMSSAAEVGPWVATARFPLQARRRLPAATRMAASASSEGEVDARRRR